MLVGAGAGISLSQSAWHGQRHCMDMAWHDKDKDALPRDGRWVR